MKKFRFPLHTKSQKEIKYISLREVKDILNYSQGYLEYLCREKKLKAVKIGREWFTTKEWIKNFKERKEIKKSIRLSRFWEILGNKGKKAFYFTKRKIYSKLTEIRSLSKLLFSLIGKGLGVFEGLTS
ncbi:MAG: hypothetical protein QME61_03495, partial [Patescibacteria group bacterium]|nr:hypothetical protein [Patescibacteria group bacterium]